MKIVIEISDSLIEQELGNEGYLPLEIEREDRNKKALEIVNNILRESKADERISVKYFYDSEI